MAALESAQALAEVGGTYLALTARLLGGMPALQAVGCIQAAATAAYTATGLALLARLLPPRQQKQ